MMVNGEARRADIHVCSLAALPAVVSETAASHIVTVINPWSIPDTPPGILPARHLKLAVNDIEEDQPGLVAPSTEHIDTLLQFITTWDQTNAMVIHCLAGISRSSAAAFISLCAKNPDIDEFRLARALRSASNTASPNRRMVSLADRQMGRNGRMIEAVTAIGSGQSALAAKPFSIPSSIT